MAVGNKLNVSNPKAIIYQTEEIAHEYQKEFDILYSGMLTHLDFPFPAI